MVISVISLWQPWAQWVSIGLKSIETRLHPRFASLVGQRIAIHAAARWDDSAYISALKYQPFPMIACRRVKPGICGSVFVAEHRECTSADARVALIECETRRYGLILQDPRVCAVVIPVAGSQGIWKYDAPEWLAK
jgi:hypothetical protein